MSHPNSKSKTSLATLFPFSMRDLIVTALIPMAIATYGNVKVGLVSLAIFAACILIAMLLGCWHKPDRAYKNQK